MSHLKGLSVLVPVRNVGQPVGKHRAAYREVLVASAETKQSLERQGDHHSIK